MKIFLTLCLALSCLLCSCVKDSADTAASDSSSEQTASSQTSETSQSFETEQSTDEQAQITPSYTGDFLHKHKIYPPISHPYSELTTRIGFEHPNSRSFIVFAQVYNSGTEPLVAAPDTMKVTYPDGSASGLVSKAPMYIFPGESAVIKLECANGNIPKSKNKYSYTIRIEPSEKSPASYSVSSCHVEAQYSKNGYFSGMNFEITVPTAPEYSILQANITLYNADGLPIDVHVQKSTVRGGKFKVAYTQTDNITLDEIAFYDLTVTSACSE